MILLRNICGASLSLIGPPKQSLNLVLLLLTRRMKSSGVSLKGEPSVVINNDTYRTSENTNVTPKIISKIGKNLHNRKHHPLNLIRHRIQDYFYKTFQGPGQSPLFAVLDNLSPVVTTVQNFDSLLVPVDHVSRSVRDTYYINNEYLLRAHTSAHQVDVMKMGFDAFLVVGDVYRRDEIDASHYPVFHQMEGVRLFNEHQLFQETPGMKLFEDGKRVSDKQQFHTADAARIVECDLKQTLLGLAQHLFGKDVETRWVDEYFPFTHPSFELEVKFQGKWMEVLGCGIIEQELLHSAGVGNKIGWAFGLGLERLAMKLFSIPDIRLFWSEDSGFLSQFQVNDSSTSITYNPISLYPQCTNDISFWIPTDREFCSNDFYDLVRTIGGDLVEQVKLFDEFYHAKNQRTSHAYRIVYRHMEKTLTQDEVNYIHSQIEEAAVNELNVVIR
ncbi:phenylalanine--tRNA ligase, mitochondrial-like [Tubulanus polymorphus]|uniref:phenylalanine--tRNA ligase, mitochondrial-like n=1 Tax=Tubulanus polymorphus TaxID=672921 RepID=UPI003DA251F8